MGRETGHAGGGSAAARTLEEEKATAQKLTELAELVESEGNLEAEAKTTKKMRSTAAMERYESTSDRIAGLGADTVKAMEQRPYTCLAIAGGLAFAIGALWAIKRQQREATWDRLYAQMPAWPLDSWRRGAHIWRRDSAYDRLYAQPPRWSLESWWRGLHRSPSNNNAVLAKLLPSHWF